LGAANCRRAHDQPPLTRCGIVKEYNITTAPPASIVHGAQAGGEISRQVVCVLFGSTFSTAFSIAIASTPNKQQYAPIAKKNDRHMIMVLCLSWHNQSSSANIDAAQPPAEARRSAVRWCGKKPGALARVERWNR
jgi:hypothetical protein